MKLTSEIRLENLKLLVTEAGGVTELSKKAGYKQPSYLYQIINRTPVQNGKAKNIGAIMAAKLEIAMNKPKGWMDQEHKKVTESNAIYLGTMEVWDNTTPVGEDEVEVPFYKEICLSAGSGFADNIEDYNGFRLRFARSTLKKHSINPAYVVCVTADGDSMSPVIPDGSTIGINTDDTQIRDGKIYAINHDGLLRIKILKKRPGNKLLIQSFNSAEYADEEANMEEINIIGRVFWWSVLA
ncbi:MAG: helix-turn-helix transcriptional regulator [Snodgrassella sp.]|nr:helix-turn-helix transcriptional regulator [Snodgrassella sp.]